MRTKRIAAAVASLCVAAALSGCGGHEVDQEAWERELADVGQTPSDMAKLEEITRDLCDKSVDELKTFVAVHKDAGSSMEALRVDFRNVCPDKLDDLREAENAVQGAVDDLREACAKAESARTQDEKDLVEAVGCS